MSNHAVLVLAICCILMHGEARSISRIKGEVLHKEQMEIEGHATGTHGAPFQIWTTDSTNEQDSKNLKTGNTPVLAKLDEHIGNLETLTNLLLPAVAFMLLIQSTDYCWLYTNHFKMKHLLLALTYMLASAVLTLFFVFVKAFG